MFDDLPFSVQERDVDLLILEQLHLSPEFVSWIAGKTGTAGGRLESARHSVFETKGETDVLLFLGSPQGRVAVMIEDKIGAAMQPRQCERYHERGSVLCSAGEASSYTTVLCAPRSYIAQIPADQNWHVRIALEEISDWLAPDPSPAARWRRAILDAAVFKANRARQAYDTSDRAFDPALRALKQAYKQLVRERYPEFKATEQLGSDREYYLGAFSLPSGIRFKHSFFGGNVSLILERRWADIEESWVAANAPAGSWIVRHAGELHIRKSADVLDPARPLGEQEATALQGLDEIRQLANFAEKIVCAHP